MPVSKGRRKKKSKNRSPNRPVPVTTKKDRGPSPTWYVVTMFGLMGIGVLVIVLNYVGLIPGGASNLYLWVGLLAIAVGFGMTLNFR